MLIKRTERQAQRGHLAAFVGQSDRSTDRRTFLMALASGAFDATANVCYVLATRAGLFGLAVVITSLYPGITVLLARLTLGERMRSLQRAGLALAALGIVLLAA